MDDGDLALVSYDSFKMEIKIYLGKKHHIFFQDHQPGRAGKFGFISSWTMLNVVGWATPKDDPPKDQVY